MPLTPLNGQPVDTKATESQKHKISVQIMSERPKRICKEIDRLGVDGNGINDDDLFDEIDANNNTVSKATSQNNSVDSIIALDSETERENDPERETINANKSNVSEAVTENSIEIIDNNFQRDANDSKSDEEALLGKMTEGEKIIFKRVLEIAADLKSMKKHFVEFRCGNVEQNGVVEIIVDKDVLQEIGLPLDSTQGLDEFEEKLKQTKFEKNVVCTHLYICIYFSNL